MKSALRNIYEHHYRKLQLIPLLLVLLAFVQIGWQYTATGDFVNKGISLKGGSTITLEHPADITARELEEYLHAQFPAADISVRTLSSAGQTVGIAVDSDVQEQGDIGLLLDAISQKVSLETTGYSVEVIGSSLGENFFRQTLIALILAFVLMSIVVFLYFRSFIPSMAVIAAAFSDIVVTLAIFNFTGMKLSSAGIAAFLMLIGYSVDTDILLNSRVLKRREGTEMERIYGAIKTGMTMTATTLSAIVVALLLVQSEVVKQIMLVLFIGLLVDIVMTWIQNVYILRRYLERKRGSAA